MNSSPPSRASVCSPPKRATVSVDAQRLLEPPRDADEQLVAGEVAEAVVDDLEAIDVEEEHRERPALGVGAARAISRSSRSMNSTRLGRPVSGSARRAVTCVRMRASAIGKSIGLVT